jgi:hypothetical protein
MREEVGQHGSLSRRTAATKYSTGATGPQRGPSPRRPKPACCARRMARLDRATRPRDGAGRPGCAAPGRVGLWDGIRPGRLSARVGTRRARRADSPRRVSALGAPPWRRPGRAERVRADLRPLCGTDGRRAILSGPVWRTLAGARRGRGRRAVVSVGPCQARRPPHARDALPRGLLAMGRATAPGHPTRPRRAGGLTR